MSLFPSLYFVIDVGLWFEHTQNFYHIWSVRTYSYTSMQDYAYVLLYKHTSGSSSTLLIDQTLCLLAALLALLSKVYARRREGKI